MLYHHDRADVVREGMATTKEYQQFIAEQLSLLEDVTFKKMMGEYLVYYRGVYLAGIFDDRLLVKKVKTNEKYHLEEQLPYVGAKAMRLVDFVDDKQKLKALFEDTYQGF